MLITLLYLLVLYHCYMDCFVANYIRPHVVKQIIRNSFLFIRIFSQFERFCHSSYIGHNSISLWRCWMFFIVPTFFRRSSAHFSSIRLFFPHLRRISLAFSTFLFQFFNALNSSEYQLCHILQRFEFTKKINPIRSEFPRLLSSGLTQFIVVFSANILLYFCCCLSCLSSDESCAAWWHKQSNHLVWILPSHHWIGL